MCSRARLPRDFVMLDENHPVLKSSPQKLVTLKAGDLALWDSRTVHCNTPASPAFCAANLAARPHSDDIDRDLIRLTGYVCMVPRSRASPEVLTRRRVCVHLGMQTSHWPDANIHPHPAHEEIVGDNGGEHLLAGLSPEERALV